MRQTSIRVAGVMGESGWSEIAYRAVRTGHMDNRALVRVTERPTFPPPGGRDLEESRRLLGHVAKLRNGRSWSCGVGASAVGHIRGATGAAADRCHDRHHPANHGR